MLDIFLHLVVGINYIIVFINAIIPCGSDVTTSEFLLNIKSRQIGV